MRPLPLYAASGTLDSVAMDLIKPLPKTNQASQYIFVTRDRDSTRAMHKSKIPSTHMANIFLDQWIVRLSSFCIS